ncbi:MAG: 16S rRNA (adenine(1518)-N(6)/adenine(1519)-N(6))-dimethyltransferase RsmA [Halanaerobiales bacterium]|nr:16S rRNA (adenine(1518)-N(6)/adenine(1519)-N(6))-dimethyltransferase RsmA [Halanaerobiales bacterium]
MDKEIADLYNTKDILSKYNIRLNKNLGQHFLVSNVVLNKIIKASDLKGNEKVIEIGAGIGSLTQYLLKVLEKGELIAIEKDTRFITILSDFFNNYDNLIILKEDILNIDWDNFIKKYDLEKVEIKIIANLPYYITTAIIKSLLFSPLKINSMVFMIQREVAERLVAQPGTKAYGSLSVFIQFHYKVEIKFEVPPKFFIPKPKVHSAVIKLTPYQEIPYKVKNKEFFFNFVKAIFNLRRKNIKNSLKLSPLFKMDKELIIEGLRQSNIDPRIRGEKLEIPKLVSLSNIYWELKKKE